MGRFARVLERDRGLGPFGCTQGVRADQERHEQPDEDEPDPEHSREPAGQHGLDRCGALGVSRRHDDEHDDERDDFRSTEDNVALLEIEHLLDVLAIKDEPA